MTSAEKHRTDDLDGAVVMPSPRLDVDELVRRTGDLLAAGVPLSLLLDLAEPPDSHALYAAER